MKNTKTKIILSVIVFLSVAGFVNTANAASASLYVSPASLTKTAGDTFNVSVGFNASGNKVCAVEGTLVLNNLSCQSITLAGDVTPQSSPTCSNPHFLIGVPSCTTVDKVLFTVSVTAGNAGVASISSTGVDIIGEGSSLGSASISGSYTISAVSKPTPALTQPNYQYSPTVTTPVKTTPKTTTVSSTKTKTPTVTAPIAIISTTSTTTSPTIATSSLLAAVDGAITLGTGSPLVSALLSAIVVLLVVYGLYYYRYYRRVR